ncbi:copper chaperone PCu(A)C [Phaeobacter marinintestinus]|uniref:copper chaperone PCu(A)C n=1 Tax=Falsiphaeobacter marinintestinus TaxID=1492905 RepID=UPI0011B65EEF|nr:copper chaperone PCu(A)C [Phaeobacter marinintestinus]
MSLKSTLFAAVAAAALAMPAFAGDIMVHDPYARASTKMSTSGAAFMVLMNHSAEDDRLVSASSDVAQRVELHTHMEDANGVMKMMEVEEGFPVPAGGEHALARGGDHVMFLGLNQPFNQGDLISVTLTFEKAGDVVVEIPVDLERKPMHGGQMKHQHGTPSAGD